MPWDQACPGVSGCASNVSPTFFTEQMLAKVHSQIYSGTSYADVDTWALTHSFPDPGDGTSAALWLDRISRTGYAGASSLAMPDVVLHGTAMTNRVWAVDGLAPLAKYRISSIDTDTGASIAVQYAAQDCQPGDIPTLNASPQTNTRRCYPQWWTPQVSPPQPAQQDWFHIYPVTSVSADPRTGGSGQPVDQTYYTYTGTPAYRYDTSPFTPDAKRNWSIYAGYSRVRVSHGDINTPSARSATDYLFFQGMDGDRAAPAGGTKSVSVTASDGSTVTDSPWFAGRVREKIDTVGVGGAAVDDTISTPWASAATANDGTVTAHHTGDADVLTKTSLAAGGTRNTDTKTTFDGNGRPVAVDDLGDTATAADDRCTRTSYADNTTAWLMSYASEVTVVGKTCTVTPSLPADAISESRSSYDNGAWGAAPSKGDPTTVQVVKSYTGSTPNWLTTATSSYDALGRVTAVTDPRTGTNRTTTTAYTPAAGGPVTQVVSTNPLGWTTTATYDPARHTETSSVDANAYKTEATYDALGRRTQVWLPNHTLTAYPTVPSTAYAYTISTSAPNVIAATGLTAAGGQVTGYTLYDGLLRPRQTQAPAEGGGRDLTDTFYDAAGRVNLTYSSYYATGNPAGTLFVPSTTVPSQAQTLYDGAGRKTAEILLGNNAEKWRTSYGYGGDHVNVTPPAGGTATSTWTDARGNTTALWQYKTPTPTGNPADADKTSYSYWPSGPMKTMTDPAGNQWGWTHDVLRRLTDSTDPDKGATHTGYDDANRITSTVDARSVTLAYSYDTLDRKTGEFLGTTGGTQLAAWAYDTVSKGQLTSSTRYTAGATGPAFVNQVTSYDAADRPTGTKVTIPAGYGPLTGSYTNSYAFGQNGAPTSQTDPAAGGLPAETINIGYDSLGQQSGLSSLAGGAYLVGTTYDHLNRLVQSTQSKSAATVYRTFYYDDPTNRLTELLTQHPATSGAVIADRSYSYTNAGDVTSISDNTPSVGVDTQCFSHDYLRQLTAAWTPNTSNCAAAPTSSTLGGPAPYWQSYSYDTIGNRTSIIKHATSGTGTATTDTYAYPTPGAGSVRPHAVQTVTHTGGTTGSDSYGYDQAGNTTSRRGQTLTYENEGHLATVTVAGVTKQSEIYDADGNRLLHTDPTGTTLYLGDTELHANPNATAASGVRTYAALGQPCAERTTTVGITGSKLAYLDPDPHFTATALIDTATNTITRRHVDPYGNNRDTTAATWIDNHSFLNKPIDALTATTHLGAREYDPTLGRFLAVDPVLDPKTPQQNNGYNYGWNNPINKADPTGLRPACDDGPCPKDISTQTPPAPGNGCAGRGCGNDPTSTPGAPGNAAATRQDVTCLYETGDHCKSQGSQLYEQAIQMQLQDRLDFEAAMRQALDPCHLDDACQLKAFLGNVSGVTGCRAGNALDCAGLIPAGKVLKGGELAWDGAKWVHRAQKVDDGWGLNSVAETIARGHADMKHAREFPGWGVEELSTAVRDTMTYGDIRELGPRRFAFWRTNTIVVFDANHADTGTVFSGSFETFSGLN